MDMDAMEEELWGLSFIRLQCVGYLGLTQIDQGSVNWNGNGDNLDEIWCLSKRPLTSEGGDE